MRNEPYEVQKSSQHDFDSYDQADKLSLRRQFLKFNRRTTDKDLVRAALLEYLTERENELKLNNFLDSGESRDEEEYRKWIKPFVL